MNKTKQQKIINSWAKDITEMEGELKELPKQTWKKEAKKQSYIRSVHSCMEGCIRQMNKVEREITIYLDVHGIILADEANLTTKRTDYGCWNHDSKASVKRHLEGCVKIGTFFGPALNSTLMSVFEV